MSTNHYNIGDLFISEKPENSNQYVIILQPPDGDGEILVLAGSPNAKVKSAKYFVEVKPTDVQDGGISETLFFPVSKQMLVNQDSLQQKAGRINRKKIEEIQRKVVHFHTDSFYKTKFGHSEFTPGKSKVNYAGRVFDEKEIINAVDASMDYWLTEGRYSEQFAEKIADFLGVENVLLTNSGSSANLLAFSALTSDKLGAKQLKPGDEVISVAAGFPATVTPIIQYGLIPVFIDVHIPTYNINIEMMKKAITPKTKCIFIAHTLGNPFDIDAVMELANKHDLWVIEDNCDAFGSKYNGKYTGTYGHLSTISFYPAHHITTGEGGAIITNDALLAQLVRAFRDWGRDCYCSGGENNTCGKRFTQTFGNLPLGYDHKYVYSEIGYNLKMTDIQAAIGSAQMDKISSFCNKRRSNFKTLFNIFSKYPEYFILPEATAKSDPAWFSFIVTLKPDCPFTRIDISKHFNEKLIETRYLFAGNLVKQPGFMNREYRIADNLSNTDYIMSNTFFLGTYPGLKDEMFTYIEDTLKNFITQRVK
jgi:CDP-6-deoxy-D-xylo-4-hexulose-3-dehydrase